MKTKYIFIFLMLLSVLFLTESCRQDLTSGNSEIFQEYHGKMIFVYPTPLSNYGTIQFSLNKVALVSVYISDLYGRKVKQIITNQMFNKDAHAIQLDPTELPSGNYYVIVNAYGKEAFERFVVAR